MRITLTGVSGFIGFHLAKELLSRGHEIQGVDCLSDYYSIDLKLERVEALDQHTNSSNFKLIRADVTEESFLLETLAFQPEVVIHLAAQAGVRQGLSGIESYSRNNIEGFLKVLDIVKRVKPDKFLYASSSSVYGENSKVPFSESQILLKPSSIYGVTKLANELFASAVLKDSKTKVRGLRFFTVYGPYGRPDMAYFRAIGSTFADLQFQKFGTGQAKRDFTFIDDVIDTTVMLLDELSNHEIGYMDVVNIGGGNPVSINDLIETIEEITGKKIRTIQANSFSDDLPLTYCDPSKLLGLIGTRDFTSVKVGLSRTIDWFASLKPEQILRWTSV